MGARSVRIERVTRAYPDICAELSEYTRESHRGATFHGGRQEIETCWYATPFVVTRDSEALDESNFTVIGADLEKLDPDGVQKLRFGHWGYGWFEQLYVRRDHPRAILAVQSWIKALSDYPVADEEHFCRLEWERNHPADGRCYSDDPDCHPCGHVHSGYPHEPGRLHDCWACELECHCTNDPGHTQCVYCAYEQEA